LIKGSNDEPSIRWMPFKTIDSQIMKGLLLDSDHNSQELHSFMVSVSNLKGLANEENLLENDSKKSAKTSPVNQLKESDKNPFSDSYSLVTGLALNVMIISFLMVILCFLQLFTRSANVNIIGNWMSFIYSSLVIVISTLITSETYYCLIGRGKVRVWDFWVNCFQILVFIDLIFLTKVIFVNYPTKSFAFIQYILFVCHFCRFMHLFVLQTIVKMLSRQSIQYKSKLAQYIVSNGINY
jgi:hypothetical protein